MLFVRTGGNNSHYSYHEPLTPFSSANDPRAQTVESLSMGLSPSNQAEKRTGARTCAPDAVCRLYNRLKFKRALTVFPLVLLGFLCKAADADVGGSWTVATSCPSLVIYQAWSGGGPAIPVDSIDPQPFASFSAAVDQSGTHLTFFVPQGNQVKGDVSGTNLNFWQSTDWSGGDLSVSYNGAIAGNSVTGSVHVAYMKQVFDGRRWWDYFGHSTGPFIAYITPQPLALAGSPASQTAETGSTVQFRVQASGLSPLTCLWYFNQTQLVQCSTNCVLRLTNIQSSEAGLYTVVVTNLTRSVASSPAALQVIKPVQRTAVPCIQMKAQIGTSMNVDYVNSLSPATVWTTLGSVTITSSPLYWLDLDPPPPPRRFYRAWQTGAPGVIPSLEVHLIPAITVTGNPGDSFQVDYINQFGPIDAWLSLTTVTLTNSSQLYFDTSVIAQPPRLWRIVPVP